MNTVAQVVLPNWLSLGILIGLGLSVFVAGAFVVGRKAFPDPPSSGPRVSGETRRRVEIRQYLHAIDEPFAEDHVVVGETVEFYLPRRDVAITFDPRVFYAIERGGTYTSPVLVEHEMPGMFLGSRLPFETPDLGFGEGQTDEGLDRDRAAFAVLGLPASANEDEVRAAYRSKVKAVHPDQGGDPDEFKQLQEAYATAREQVAG